MDKVVEKWTSEGWVLKNTTPTQKGKYLLRFEREISRQSAIPKANLNPKGCLSILALLFVFSIIQAFSQSLRSPNRTISTSQVPATSVALARTSEARPTIEITSAPPTIEATSTPLPTATSLPSSTPLPSATPRPTNTSRPTDTPLPSNTPTPRSTPYVISSNGTINARSCASTECEVVAQLSPGTAVSVNSVEIGQAVNGNTNWLKITLAGSDAYVHSSLASFVTRQTQLSSEEKATQVPSTQAAPVICNANFRGVGGNYRVSNSYDGGHYQRYSYEPAFETNRHIEYLLEVGTEWGPPPFNLSDLGFSEGTINVNGVTVNYDFEGEPGWYELMGFSFEYAGLKFGGDITIFDDLATSELDSSLTDEMVNFARALMRMC
jgi:hypothetical protein